MNIDDSKKTIIQHIEELRHRLLFALISLLVMVVASFFFAEKVITYLTIPIGGLSKLQAIDVSENIGTYMKVALLSGFTLDFPIIIYELLRFILPGLTKKEQRYVLLSIPFITVFFLGGVAFAFFIMMKPALQFLMGFLGVKTTPRLSGYIGFVTNLLFWIGISFETPIFIFILAKFGIVSAKKLLKGWRYAIVVIAVIAAVVTPTVDPVNMAILMAPLIVLYFISILLAFFARRKSKQEEIQSNGE
jgi:sec-independent protein translocase protein TatC